jgi:dipeptidyl aminopeptidase/acylaminoacyl peptidase
MMTLAALWLAGATAAHAQVDLAPYLKRDVYETIKISPDGKHYAATMPMDDRTAIVVLSRADKGVVSGAAGEKNSAVHDFWWVDDKRIVIAMAETFGSKDTRYRTGELYALDIGASRIRKVFGAKAPTGMVSSYGWTGPHEMATLIDPLPDEPDHVLIATWPQGYDPLTRIERLNVVTGGRTRVASAPTRRADFTIDARGVVRFAEGWDSENHSQLYYREHDKAEWELINDQRTSGRAVSALGLSVDGTTAYLRRDRDDGPDVIETWDPRTKTGKPLLADPVVDPYSLIHDRDGRTPIGARYMHDGVRTRFFDDNLATARMRRSLEKALPGSAVSVTSFTRDGKVALLHVSNDRMPGDYALYNTETRTVSGIFAQREWFDPQRTAATRLVSLRARDDTALHGYLTLPHGSAGKGLPLVVVPHGGPFAVFDEWGFDDEAQMLAEAGYAVLRVNYRGSGNYGRKFRHLGARQWGGTMQDDLTDATRWAIDEGIADRSRICIYGASYGGYAALMGAAKEPELYRCAVGYVGVYDLVAMHRDDSRHARWWKNWVNEWVGERDTLASKSPTELASRIKAPVFLAAGGADPRAPIAHSKKMERALRSANVPVETLYFDSEGHGFTTEPHRRAFYTQLLDFLSRHIGGAKAK